MRRSATPFALCLILTLGIAAAVPALAVSRSDFDAALSAAKAADGEAGALRNRWTSTQDAIAASQKAAGAGDYDEAVRLAERAKAMAVRSIEQAKEQSTAWRDAVVR